MEIRCSNKKHGELTTDGLLEVACDSRFCGKEKGVVVLHRFKPETGELVETLRFKAPLHPQSSERNG